MKIFIFVLSIFQISASFDHFGQSNSNSGSMESITMERQRANDEETIKKIYADIIAYCARVIFRISIVFYNFLHCLNYGFLQNKIEYVDSEFAPIPKHLWYPSSRNTREVAKWTRPSEVVHINYTLCKTIQTTVSMNSIFILNKEIDRPH